VAERPLDGSSRLESWAQRTVSTSSRYNGAIESLGYVGSDARRSASCCARNEPQQSASDEAFILSIMRARCTSRSSAQPEWWAITLFAALETHV